MDDRLATINMGRNLERAVPMGRGVELGPHLTQCSKCHLDSSSRLATSNMGRKLGGRLCPFFQQGELGLHLAQCGLGRGLPPYHMASRCMQPFGHNRYGPKAGGCAPLAEGGARSPSNTIWPGLRPIHMPSFILIRSAVWPQYTNVTDRTGQIDNGPMT